MSEPQGKSRCSLRAPDGARKKTFKVTPGFPERVCREGISPGESCTIKPAFIEGEHTCQS